MVNKSTQIVIFALLLIVTLACNLSTGTLPLADKNLARLTATLPASPTLSPSPPPSPSPASSPTEPVPVIPAEIISIPEADFDDLSLYRQVMLTEFADDVGVVAKTGASRYYLEITLDKDGFTSETGLALNGVERIHYTNTENVSLSEIYLRLYPNLPGYDGQMTVQTTVIDGQIVEPELRAEKSALRVPLPQALAPGEVADIGLIYNALVPRRSLFGYNIFVYQDDAVTLAGFYPAIAVYDDDEGWDVDIPPPYGDATYLDVSLYQVQLTVPEQMVVAASGSQVKSVLNDDGTKTLRLISGPMRDFYVAMRENYQVVSETVDGVVVNSYYPPDLEAGGKLALRYAVDSLRVFNRSFGQYPYAEFDVAATSTTAGGVEYPGIVVINQDIYSFEGGFFQQTVSHEVAHQWWYGLVGNDQIDEPWLDESLTNYSTILYWEAIEGVESANKILDSFFLGPYQEARASGQDRAVVGPVEDFSERDYGIFVYSKGPLFFNALRQEVGDETYLKIMRSYHVEYKYKIAHADNLLTVIERVSGRDIDPLFETWLQNSQ